MIIINHLERIFMLTLEQIPTYPKSIPCIWKNQKGKAFIYENQLGFMNNRCKRRFCLVRNIEELIPFTPPVNQMKNLNHIELL